VPCLILLQPTAQAEVGSAYLRFTSETVGVYSSKTSDRFFGRLSAERCPTRSLNDPVQEVVGLQYSS
jgi:hypothetical protein